MLFHVGLSGGAVETFQFYHQPGPVTAKAAAAFAVAAGAATAAASVVAESIFGQPGAAHIHSLAAAPVSVALDAVLGV